MHRSISLCLSESVPLPDGSNVFYAIDRASDSVRLIVRDKELGYASWCGNRLIRCETMYT